ncbi:MAG: thymidine phosphorylase [Armatimonadetes bacterium]|nr:thymidine phosphorylase [Armatimonadota bacterium]
MNIVRLIEKKRDGGEHTREEIQFIVEAAAAYETRPDYEGSPNGVSKAQLAAWLMAVVWRGMTLDETALLTQAMAESGDQLNLDGLPKPWADKHSTGGVGDKTTLVVLPMMAACGLTSVKMSGRGLGKTGGTIDKLESIPGFRTNLSLEEMKSQAAKIGIALTGQSGQLTPADKTLYALRDVTGTVASIPLIASSVISKKIAGGAEVISIDLKCGSGAFMADIESARNLGQTMIEIGKRLGRKVGVEITDMDQPLGRAAGNLNEVQEAIWTLSNDGPKRFTELCIELCAGALLAAGKANNPDDAREKSEQSLISGRALALCAEWFKTQGSTLSLEEICALPLAAHEVNVCAPRAGWISRISADAVGQAVVDLGGGRHGLDDQINHLVGISTLNEIGEEVECGQPIFEIRAATEESAQSAELALSAAIEISDNPVERRPVVIEKLS